MRKKLDSTAVRSKKKLFRYLVVGTGIILVFFGFQMFSQWSPHRSWEDHKNNDVILNLATGEKSSQGCVESK